MAMQYDYLVIGAGVSGAAAAYELAPSGSALLVDAESAPGYHSTGRSAALYTRNFGAPVVRRISQAGHAFFCNPPPGFAARPLLTPRGSLTIAPPGQEDLLGPVLGLSAPGHEVEPVTAARALEIMPLLRPERVAAAAYERGVMDMDVEALHQGYLRGIRHRGGEILCGHRIERLDHRGEFWHVTADGAAIEARVLVNAAGAWAGQIGEMAGAASIGIVPRRRTAIIVEAPEGVDVRSMPAIDYVGTEAYFKPDAGRIMASPGDQTPVEPQDAQPDDWDVAVVADWLQRETLLPVRHIAHRWAGLRSFVADEGPVVGFDAAAPNFFWLAGQGGYGIMMAPALGRATAGLIVSGALPADLRASISESELSPARLA